MKNNQATLIGCSLFAGLVLGCSQGSSGNVPSKSPAPPSAPAAVTPLETDIYVASEAGFRVTSTLIKGNNDAILIDAQFLLSEGTRVAEWIARSGKNLKAIYITHAHPDHYFGVESVLAAFPGTPVYATATVVEHMREMAPGKLAFWKPIVGDDLTSTPIVPTVLDRDYLELEGQRIDIIALGQGDMADSTVVHIPSLDTVIAGDVAFRGVHLWLVETDARARAKWMASLDQIAALQPAKVIAGHKNPALDESISVLADNRAYIEAFDQLVARGDAPEATVAAMQTSYADHSLPLILELSAKAAHGAAGSGGQH